MEKKITKKDNFNAIIEVLMEVGRKDLAEVIQHEVELLDKKAAKAKANAEKKKAENDELTNIVAAILTNDYQTISDITNQIDDEDVTSYKVTNRLTRLVNSKYATKEQVTITGTNGKVRKVMGYKLLNDEN